MWQVLLVQVMGVAAALAGIVVTLIIVPLGSWTSRRMASIGKKLSEASDARMKITTEVCAPGKQPCCVLGIVLALQQHCKGCC